MSEELPCRYGGSAVGLLPGIGGGPIFVASTVGSVAFLTGNDGRTIGVPNASSSTADGLRALESGGDGGKADLAGTGFVDRSG